MTQTAIKERGIIFTAWSIPKVMDGTKTQTRRTYGLEFVNQDPDAFEFLRMEGDLAVFHKLRNSYRNAGEIPFSPISSFPKKRAGVAPNALFYIKCPYGQVGDRLWVKETWAGGIDKTPKSVDYKADGYDYGIDKLPWKSPRFMPRWASRTLLEITNLRAERLQEITEEDAKTEGVESYYTLPGGKTTARYHFSAIWDSLNAKRGYGFDFNPWVWPIGFKGV